MENELLSEPKMSWWDQMQLKHTEEDFRRIVRGSIHQQREEFLYGNITQSCYCADCRFYLTHYPAG